MNISHTITTERPPFNEWIKQIYDHNRSISNQDRTNTGGASEVFRTPHERKEINFKPSQSAPSNDGNCRKESWLVSSKGF